MIHFDTYNVHIYKPVTRPWSEQQYTASVGDFIDDAELCGLLEVVTTMYLEQRGPLARDLVVGARLFNDYEMAGYEQPFRTPSLHDALPMLRQMVDELEGRVRRADEEAVDVLPGGEGAATGVK